MKLASFLHDGDETIGFEHDGALVRLDAAMAAAGLGEAVSDMGDFIRAGAPALQIARRARDHVEANSGVVPHFAMDAVTMRPPVRRPYKICGVAMNNSASDSRKISAPDHPLFFLKPASCLIGHGEAIEARSYYGSVHPEPELGVVIAKDCRDVKAEDADDVIFGYTIFNDMTGNSMRAEDMVHYYALYPRKDNPDEVERREQHLSYTARYKGSDGFGPMGPYLVTKDDVADPHALEVKCWHKGELIAEDSTAYYTYSVQQVIAFITRYHTLWAGDVISMGTAFRPSAGGKRSLHTANITALGGPVAVEISGLGRLENPVRNV